MSAAASWPVVIVGAPGSGKSTVGPLLARELGVAFRDTDADIEATAGKAISDIFLDDGEQHFRRLEHDAVADAVRTHDGVLSLGGGAIMDPRSRAILAGTRVVWLEVSFADAVKRVGLGASRPVLHVNPRATLRALMTEREPLYAEVATIRCDTSGREPEDVARDLAAQLTGETT